MQYRTIILTLLLPLSFSCGAESATTSVESSAHLLVPTPFCTTATAEAIHCDDTTPCAPPFHCTRSWNRDIEWQTSGTSFGHCVDPSGTWGASAAIQADLCTLPHPADYSTGVPYRLPPNGNLLIDDHDNDRVGVHVFRRTTIEGSGAVLSMDRSIDDAEEAFVGIRFRTGAASFGEEYAGPTSHASWSSFRDVTIRPSSNYSFNSMVGIRILSHGIRLDNVRVMSLGVGIDVDGPENVANSNSFSFSNLLLTGHYSYAAYIHGQDSSAGLLSGLEVMNGAGVRDSSYSGNTYIAATSEGNLTSSTDLGVPLSFMMEDGAHSTMIGTYVESSDPVPSMVNGALPVWVGGTALTVLPPETQRVGRNHSRLVFEHYAQPLNQGYRVTIPGNPSSSTRGAIFFQRRDEAWGWRLSAPVVDWGFFPEGSGSFSPISWRSFVGVGASTDPNPGRFSLGVRSTEQGNCTDGIDNDRDGDVDSDDSDCP